MQMASLFHDERLKLVAAPSCEYCGIAGLLSIDHLVPRASGGGDREHNLVRACRSCNSSKGSRDLLAWLTSQDRFPPLMLLRRYLKLVFVECQAAGLLDCELTDERLGQLPFEISLLPRSFPPLSALAL